MPRRSPPVAKKAAQARRVVLICVAFVVMMVMATIADRTFDGPIRQLLSTPPVERQVSHVGSIRLAPGRDGRCPEMQFDNDTGIIVPIGSAVCEIDETPPAWGSGGTNRMDSIREGFRRR
ncbi:MAG: hypothetical protein HZA68_11150 [Rhodovulum sp.]|nr:hypothetical protein [Rhodovulum sp.]